MKIFHSLHDPELATMIRNGAVGVVPTDTLYGLVANAHTPAAVTRLYELKHREQKPGTTIAANIPQLGELGLDRHLLADVGHYWPNPLSVIMPHDLDYIHAGKGDSPFRVVAEPELQQFLEQTGPLVTSSANQPGQPPARNLAEAQAYFGDQVDFYVDGGEFGDRLPSTIIAINKQGKVTVIREGAVKINDVEQKI